MSPRRQRSHGTDAEYSVRKSADRIFPLRRVWRKFARDLVDYRISRSESKPRPGRWFIRADNMGFKPCLPPSHCGFVAGFIRAKPPFVVVGVDRQQTFGRALLLAKYLQPLSILALVRNVAKVEMHFDCKSNGLSVRSTIWREFPRENLNSSVGGIPRALGATRLPLASHAAFAFPASAAAMLPAIISAARRCGSSAKWA